MTRYHKYGRVEKYGYRSSNRLREIREAHNTSQADLAKFIGVSTSSISNAESGRSSLPLKRKIASAMGESITSIFPEMVGRECVCERCGTKDVGAGGLCWKCCIELLVVLRKSMTDFISDRSGKESFGTIERLFVIADLAKDLDYEEYLYKEYGDPDGPEDPKKL